MKNTQKLFAPHRLVFMGTPNERREVKNKPATNPTADALEANATAPAKPKQQQPPPNFMDEAARQGREGTPKPQEAKKPTEPAIKKIEGDELKNKVGEHSKEIKLKDAPAKYNAIVKELSARLQAEVRQYKHREQIWHGDQTSAQVGDQFCTLVVDKSATPPYRIFAVATGQEDTPVQATAKAAAAKKSRKNH